MSSYDWEIEKLGLMMLGHSDEESEELMDTGILEAHLADKYYLSFEDFQDIVERLIKFTPVIVTVLTKTPVHAFIKDNLIIVKQEVEDE